MIKSGSQESRKRKKKGPRAHGFLVSRLDLFCPRKKLARELRADLKHLKSKAVRLVDKLTITQGDIMLIRGRLQRLTK